MINLEQLRNHVYDVIGAIHEVHRGLGPGLCEACYQEALAMELKESGVPAEREFSFHPRYRGVVMESVYRVDFLCKDDIIVECKAVEDLNTNHRSQLFNYMRLMRKPCGILVNFAPHYMVVERYFYDDARQEILTVDGRTILGRKR